MKVATGTIVSVIAGYYFVEHDEQIYLCRGRGKLRKEGKPLTGDKIRFSFKVEANLVFADHLHANFRKVLGLAAGVIIQAHD